MSNYECTLCPRMCRADRKERLGFCGSKTTPKVARAALHKWEEPCICAGEGSGTVFFSGCTLKCCYCQNFKISHESFGKEVSVQRLSEIFLNLQEKGAININLVSPTHYVPQILKALDMSKNKLHIPVVYNTGGYERVETIKSLDGYVDIYLTDLKYFSSELSQKYSKCNDYFKYASNALLEMTEQTGKYKINDNGILEKGVIVRHLVLPGLRKDSMEILKWLNEQKLQNKILLSLMRQYTPIDKNTDFPELQRRITTFEYNSVLDKAIEFSFTNGYTQEKESATLAYTPPFNLEGI